MKPFDVKGNTYFDFGKGSDDKNPKFKVGDNLKASKYKDIFAKGYNEKELLKTTQTKFRVEVVTNRKGNKLHVK